MGPFFLFNDVFLILTSLLGVIPGYPGVISFSAFLFFSSFFFILIVIFLAWRRCGI